MVTPLTFQWEQMDTGLSTNTLSFGTDLGNNALFRSYEPRTVSSRDFPALGTQLNNGIDDAEVLPSTERDLNFRLTVRDGMSGQVTDDVNVTVTTGSGPFRVTSHSVPASIVPYRRTNTD